MDRGLNQDPDSPIACKPAPAPTPERTRLWNEASRVHESSPGEGRQDEDASLPSVKPRTGASEIVLGLENAPEHLYNAAACLQDGNAAQWYQGIVNRYPAGAAVLSQQ